MEGLVANIEPTSYRSDHPPGAICVASGELSRYPQFTHSLNSLLRPRGTTLELHCGLRPADNFNAGLRRMLANPALQWAWIMGDDHQFEPTTLLRLLERELDVVVPLCVRRQPPLIPTLFKAAESETVLGQLPPYHWHQLPQHGLMEVPRAGSGGMLVRRRVLTAMSDPWFETVQYEDIRFCDKVRNLGFAIYVDLDVQLDHWTPISLRPLRLASGQWTVGILINQTMHVALPPEYLLQMVESVRDQSHENFGLEPVHGRT